MTEIIGVRFKNAGKTYFFSPGGQKLSPGDRVIVETARGIECGSVAIPNRLIDDGQINEAENLLLDGLEADSRAYFELTLMFYEKLNGKTDEFLEEHDYSREEVTDGIKYVVDFYGYGSLMDAFVDENALG